LEILFEVQRQLCDLWDISHSEIIEFTPTYRQMWEYEPGQLPKMTALDPPNKWREITLPSKGLVVAQSFTLKVSLDQPRSFGI